MKVLHLSIADFGPNGICSYRLHKQLQKRGVDSYMLTFIKSSGDPSVKMMVFDLLNRTEVRVVERVPPNTNTILNLAIEDWSEILKREVVRGGDKIIFSMPDSLVDLSKIKEVEDADIVHVHWAPGMFDFLRTPLWFFDKPVIFTVYDSWLFTGGCHSIDRCENYLGGCKDCPLISYERVKGIPPKNFEIKQRCIELLQPHVVFSSNYLMELGEKSPILRSVKRELIYSGIPTYFLFRRNKNKAREFLHLPVKGKIVLLLASSFKDKNKELEEFFYSVRKIMDKSSLKDIYFVCVGTESDFIKRYPGIHIIRIGFVPFEDIISYYLSASDVFVRFGEKDRPSSSLLEAMWHGLPVVTFENRVIKEILNHKYNGYIVEDRNFEKLVEGILWILDNDIDRKRIIKNARKLIKSNFDLDVTTEKYLQIYEKTTKQKNIPPRDLLISLGEELFLQKDIENALGIFNKILDAYGEDGDVFNNIGVIFWERGLLVRAYEYFKRAFELKPEDSVIRNNMEQARKAVKIEEKRL